jgi:hypothetical protein
LDESIAKEKNKIQNQQSSVTSIKDCVHVVKIVEMDDDEELYAPDDVLKEANAARYQMLPKKKTNYIIRKHWKNLQVNENQ